MKLALSDEVVTIAHYTRMILTCRCFTCVEYFYTLHIYVIVKFYFKVLLFYVMFVPLGFSQLYRGRLVLNYGCKILRWSRIFKVL